MACRTLYLHIGAPKAASTTLQKEVFPNLQGLTFLKKPKLGLVDGRFPWDGEFARMILYSCRIWDRLGQAFFDRLIAAAEEKGGANQDILVSDENMSVNRSIDPVHLGNHFSMVEKWAKSYGFDAIKLLFITRRQDEWLASIYAQLSNRMPHAGQRHFDAWATEQVNTDMGYYSHGISLDYLEIYNEAANVFGEKNIFFLPLELMTRDPVGFISKITDFLGINGLAHSEIQRLVSNRLNVRSVSDGDSDELKKWRLRPRHKWMKWYKRSIQLDPHLSERVLAAYKTSNKTISEKTGFDLGEFGYY